VVDLAVVEPLLAAPSELVLEALDLAIVEPLL